MAHVAKYTAAQAASMIRHYERKEDRSDRKHSNKNIDPSRTHLNYGWSNLEGSKEFLRKRLDLIQERSTRKLRKDAVVMFDWVVTAPEDLRLEDTRKFFQITFDFLERRYGAQNLITAQVHMDETTPHMHYAAIPETEDGRLCCKEFINRAELKRFHSDLTKEIEKELGYKVSILLPEEKKQEKALSHVPQKDLDAARDALVEKLQQENAELAQENAELKKGIEALEKEKGGLEAKIEGLQREKCELVVSNFEVVVDLKDQSDAAFREAQKVKDEARAIVSETYEVLQSLNGFFKEAAQTFHALLDEPVHDMVSTLKRLANEGLHLPQTALKYGRDFLTQRDYHRGYDATEREFSDRSQKFEKQIRELTQRTRGLGQMVSGVDEALKGKSSLKGKSDIGGRSR